MARGIINKRASKKVTSSFRDMRVINRTSEVKKPIKNSENKGGNANE